MENQEDIQKNIEIKKEEKKEKKPITLEMRIIGWAGSILIIVAYTINSLGYLDSQNILYPILNLAGAFFMGIRVFADRNWSNFLLEIFWAAIAVISIAKFFIR